jgi:hypothetical protein
VDNISSIDDYFREYGHWHVKKATTLLQPLHVPGQDQLPNFPDSLRQPYEPQAHAIAACIAMLDESKRGIIAAEMGTGKTLMAMLTVHEHARRPVRKGGRNGRYRALVLCPDHLISKWRDELVATIPGVRVTTFDVEGKGCRQLITDMNSLYTSARGPDGRWRKPEGPEWAILGRDQSKLMPTRVNLGFQHTGYLSRKLFHRFRDRHGEEQTTVTRQYLCPQCGAPILGKEDKAIDVPHSTKLLRCEGKFGREITEDGCSTGKDLVPVAHRDRYENMWNFPLAKHKPGQVVEKGDKRYKVCACNERLWQFTGKPRRWPPAVFLAKKMPGFFTYMICDEIHEQKSNVSAQANAFGKLASSCRYCLALTGTIVGGYAKDIFYLLMRLDARPLLEEGLDWKSMMKFTREYGRIERIVTTRTASDGEVTVSTGARSMRKDETEKTEERPAPGIMPALFGRHLLDKSVFLSLEDLAENLPPLREYVGGPPGADYTEEDKHFYEDCRVTMNPELADEYRRVEGTLAAKCQEMLANGSMKLLSALLVAGLEYPDRPWDWRAPTEKPEHLACGYWELPGNRSPGNWRGVIQPRSLPQDVVYPKEAALLRIVEREVSAGNQVWVYCQMTGKRDIQVRLKGLLAERGYTTSILRSKAVKPRDRLDWIKKEGRKAQVIISHPQLVQTGIDFFHREAGAYSHNFNAIAFYETGYNLFTMRQAAARGLRIGQEKSCRVYYLHYRDTMQTRALCFIARKMAAAMALDGELTVEGLTALDDSGSAALALARTIAENIDDADIARNWAKVGAGTKKAPVSPLVQLGVESLEETPIDGIDLLSMESALVAQTLIDHAAEGRQFGRKLLAELFQQFFPDEIANY